VTTIDPNRRLAAAVQQQLHALRERTRAQATPGTGLPSRAAPARLSAAALQRLAAIDAADPDRQRKAVRVYLESELAREFGDGLLNDPAFPRMVDAVQEQMQDDAQLATAVQALGDLLLAQRLPSV
jgi:hypothetical protein